MNDATKEQSCIELSVTWWVCYKGFGVLLSWFWCGVCSMPAACNDANCDTGRQTQCQRQDNLTLCLVFANWAASDHTRHDHGTANWTAFAPRVWQRAKLLCQSPGAILHGQKTRAGVFLDCRLCRGISVRWLTSVKIPLAVECCCMEY